MQRHERFVEMCALAPLEELSVQQRRELDEHLLVCGTCRSKAAEFEALLADVPVALRERVLREQNEHGLARFRKRAHDEGLHFSKEVDARWRKSSSPAAGRHPPLIATGAIAALLLIGVSFGYRHFFSLRRSEPGPRVGVREAAVSPVLAVQPTPPSVPTPVVTLPVPAEQRIESLERQVKQLHAERIRLRDKLALATDQSRDQSIALQAAQNRLSEALTNAAGSNDAVTKLRSERDKMVATLAEQQQTIIELNEKLNTQAAIAEQDRRLAAAARDVRQLMGERNLHIIDVFDVESNGKSKKTFGRVFYTEGKSLIFYAFDLQTRKRSRSRVSFQAWGQKSQQPLATNFGVFALDDPSQNRWILKVEDAKLLSNVDIIFVTMERQGGAGQPTGDRVLYAYLKNPINHP